MTNIADMIHKIANPTTTDKVRMFDANVESVDMDARTCEVTMLGGESSNVITARLMASVNDGAIYKPTVNSTVIITMSDYVQPYVSCYSGIDEIIWLGGEYEGVPIVKHPTDATKGLLVKIKAIEDKLNTLLSNYNTHVHTGVTTGGGSSGTTTSVVSGSLTPTVQADIQHPNITH